MTSNNMCRTGDSPSQCAVYFTCDHEACAESITDDQAIAQGGLTKVGWTRKFNEIERKMNHFCPAHSPKEV